MTHAHILIIKYRILLISECTISYSCKTHTRIVSNINEPKRDEYKYIFFTQKSVLVLSMQKVNYGKLFSQSLHIITQGALKGQQKQVIVWKIGVEKWKENLCKYVCFTLLCVFLKDLVSGCARITKHRRFSRNQPGDSSEYDIQKTKIPKSASEWPQ